MGRWRRWIGIAAAMAAALVVLAGGAVFIGSEYVMGRGHPPFRERLAAPTPAQVADAPRQARLLGCLSCHGEGLRGNVMVDIPNVVWIQAPNITEVAARTGDQQLAAAIRQGIGHDRRPLFVMPSGMYSRLSDSEVAALIGWIRSLPRVPGRIEGFRARALGRVALVTGKLRPATAQIEDFRAAPLDAGRAHAAGRRIASVTCAECHGPALSGREMETGDVAPDLAIAGAYDFEQFKALLRTGRPPSGRKLGLMAEVARQDFVHLTEAELKALHGYLAARAAKLPD
jgi:cytochrome c553